MELNAVDERVLVDRPGVRSAPAQRFAVRLAGPSDVLPADCRERDELDGVDLDLARADPVAAAWLDPWSLPQSDRERDVPGQDVIAQLAAELHPRDATPLPVLRGRNTERGVRVPAAGLARKT